MTPGDLRTLLGHLFDASRQPLDAVPSLNDLIDGAHVVPLSRDQATRLLDLFPGTVWPAPAPLRISISNEKPWSRMSSPR